MVLSRSGGAAPRRSSIAAMLLGLAFVSAEVYAVARIIRKGKAMPVRIYHNPRCNTSRKTLALLREKGVEPEIVEYLKTPYTAAQLKTLLSQLKMPAKALVRKKEAADAGVDPAKLSEEQLIAAMVKHPILVERPIVVSGNKAALGRPPEKVLAVI